MWAKNISRHEADKLAQNATPFGTFHKEHNGKTPREIKEQTQVMNIYVLEDNKKLEIPFSSDTATIYDRGELMRVEQEPGWHMDNRQNGA